jgi:signal peptidase I
MLYIVAILLGIIVPALLLEAVILKGTVFAFRKNGLSWRAALIASLLAAPFAIGASVLGRLNSHGPAILPVQILCILGLVLLPTIVVKKSLGTRTFVSIAIVIVATVVSSFVGAAYAGSIRTFLFQAFTIPSSAMSPTLVAGDYILVNKFAYRIGSPGRGEVLVFRYPLDTSKDFVKRVVAVGGDTVEIRDKKLFVNGKPDKKDPGVNLDPHILPEAKAPRDNLPPLTVPSRSFFVLGDNRDHSLDSRFWGFVKAEHVVGRPSLVYWSYDANAKRVRTERIGERIR